MRVPCIASQSIELGFRFRLVRASRRSIETASQLATYEVENRSGYLEDRFPPEGLSIRIFFLDLIKSLLHLYNIPLVPILRDKFYLLDPTYTDECFCK